MDNPATAPIVGYDGPAPEDVQQYWLDVAWRALQGEDRSLVDNVAAGKVDVATVADVVTSAARRVLRNPEGNTSESTSLDDYQESWKKSDATEDIYFTAAELRRLRPEEPVVTGWSGSMGYSR